MNKHSEFIKKCLDDPESVTQEELQDNYEAAIKKYYAAREDRLYKLFNGSDTAVWAHDEIIKQDKRIAELELGARRLLDASTWEAQENAMAEFEELLEE